MGKKVRAFKKKDPFEDLEGSFKNMIESADETKIRAEMARAAQHREELVQAKAKDDDYQRLKEELKVAGEVYRDGDKRQRMKIRFCLQILKDRGKVEGYDADDARNEAGEKLKGAK